MKYLKQCLAEDQAKAKNSRTDPQIHSLKTLGRNKELNNSVCSYWSRMNCVKSIWLPSVKIRGSVDSEVIEGIIYLQ